MKKEEEGNPESDHKQDEVVDNCTSNDDLSADNNSANNLNEAVEVVNHETAYSAGPVLRTLEKWPLTATEIYSLSGASKQRVSELLHSKLALEKNLVKSQTELEQYDKHLNELRVVERTTLARKIEKMRHKYHSVLKRPMPKRVVAEEPNYIRVFKFYVDELSAVVKSKF